MEPDTFSRQRWFSRAGIFLFLFLCSLGTLWAFQRGGNDFNVFYSAGRLVIEGHGTQIYQSATDHYLYAPAFAWIFKALAILPRNLALFLWCAFKVLALGFAIREVSKRAWPKLSSSVSFGLGCWGALVVARPLLIDFQYGQVNSFIVAACVAALLLESANAWFTFAVAAISKIYPLSLAALLLRRGMRGPRIGFALGFLMMIVAPAINLGFSGIPQIHQAWRQALVDRGFPTEAHNQSFAAFLEHYFTGKPFQVLSEGPPPVTTGFKLLSERGLWDATLVWMVLSCLFILYWLFCSNAKKGGHIAWAAIACAILILPSHLIWKPYFVLSLPLAIVALSLLPRARLSSKVICALVIMGMNFSGFDFLGHYWGARIEAASALLFLNLLLVGVVYCESRRPRPIS